MENRHVITVDLEHDAEAGLASTEPYSWTGSSRNKYKRINGAASPLNDAHFYGTRMSQMFESWFDTPVHGTNQQQLPVYIGVHYGNDVAAAFQESRGLLKFGDGTGGLHPFTTMKIIAHEMCHVFTSQAHTSRLLYTEQSGGIDEAFSDMCGIVLESFVLNSTTFTIGEHASKNNKPLRFLENPSDDGVSIDHVDDYREGMSVHHSSGVFNKVFASLATTPGWNPRKAFHVFLRANQVYWTPTSSFREAFYGVVAASIDLEYEQTDVLAAFERVGLTVREGHSTDRKERTATFVEGSIFGDGFSGWHYFLVEVEADTPALAITLEKQEVESINDDDDSDGAVPSSECVTGDADLFVLYGDKPTNDDFDYRPFLTACSERVTVSWPEEGQWYVGVFLHSRTLEEFQLSVHGVGLKVTKLQDAGGGGDDGGDGDGNVGGDGNFDGDGDGDGGDGGGDGGDGNGGDGNVDGDGDGDGGTCGVGDGDGDGDGDGGVCGVGDGDSDGDSGSSGGGNSDTITITIANHFNSDGACGVHDDVDDVDDGNDGGDGGDGGDGDDGDATNTVFQWT